MELTIMLGKRPIQYKKECYKEVCQSVPQRKMEPAAQQKDCDFQGEAHWTGYES